jgi:hypothetical protein
MKRISKVLLQQAAYPLSTRLATISALLFPYRIGPARQPVCIHPGRGQAMKGIDLIPTDHLVS